MDAASASVESSKSGTYMASNHHADLLRSCKRRAATAKPNHIAANVTRAMITRPTFPNPAAANTTAMVTKLIRMLVIQ